jgi:NADPH-dependent curcumin reductase CurA
MHEWYDAGLLTFKADIGRGLETCVDQLNSLFTGSNTGKALVQLCDDPGPGPY